MSEPTDILQRLHALDHDGWTAETRATIRDAIGAIERLQAGLEISETGKRAAMRQVQALTRTEAEIERLREDCAQFYQVIGHLAHHAGVWDQPQTNKALDNALAASEGEPRPHGDLLPFTPVPEPSQAAAPASSLAATNGLEDKSRAELVDCIMDQARTIATYNRDAELQALMKTNNDLVARLNAAGAQGLEAAATPQPERWEPGYVTGSTAERARVEAVRINPLGSQPFAAYCDQHGTHYVWFRRRVEQRG